MIKYHKMDDGIRCKPAKMNVVSYFSAPRPICWQMPLNVRKKFLTPPTIFLNS